MKEEELKGYIDNIVDTITCADGGISFCRFNNSIKTLNNQANNGDLLAEQLVNIVKNFSNLIKSINEFDDELNKKKNRK